MAPDMEVISWLASLMTSSSPMRSRIWLAFVLDFADDFVDRGSRLLSVTRWISATYGGDFRRRFGGSFSQLAYFVGDDRKAPPIIAGTSCFNVGVEGEEIGLFGDLGELVMVTVPT